MTPAALPENPVQVFTAVGFGPDAILIRIGEGVNETALAKCRGMVRFLERNPPLGLIEAVPAFVSLLLRFRRGECPAHAELEELLSNLKNCPSARETGGRLVEIPVRYDGEDLARLSEACGLSPAEVIALHSAPLYQVYSLGFAPGFPYLGELDTRLHTPRLAVPRARVPAGSVGIGGAHTGIYPFATPGGWNLIGHTDRALFDASVEENFCLLRAGDRVRFLPV